MVVVIVVRDVVVYALDIADDPNSVKRIFEKCSGELSCSTILEDDLLTLSYLQISYSWSQKVTGHVLRRAHASCSTSTTI